MSHTTKYVYNRAWEDNVAYREWVKSVKSDCRKAYCILCCKNIDISSMGESALKSHTKSSKHRTLLNDNSSMKMESFMKSNTSPVPIQSGDRQKPAAVATPDTASFTNNFQLSDAVVKAELLWTLKLVTDHQSYKSSETANDLFKVMFPDSEIAKNFKCGERKSAYLAVYGLAEHFRKLLKSSITGPYSVLFDESLNHKMQVKQMDIYVRLWDENTNHVETRYFNSVTLGHATADDMLKHFSDAVLEQLPVKNLIQVGMDGPNVNWKFYSNLKDRLMADFDTHLLNLGSCGLHTIHNAFKAGAQATDWNISSFLSSLYYLFKDSPARREDFVSVGGDVLPMKFVNHRWLENTPVSERALQVLDNVKTYVKAVDDKKLSKPTCKSYAVVSEMCKKDKLLIAKISFFKCIAMHLQSFLAKYQTSRPMVVFLNDDLCSIIKALLRRIMKVSELQSKTDEQLMRMDVEDKKLHASYKKIDIGFACETALKESVKQNVSERELLEFRMACKEFVVQVLKKILLKSPVLYSVVRYLSSLNPIIMVSNGDKCVTMFRKLLKLLLESKRLTENECEVCLQQYSAFVMNIPKFGSERFTNFHSNVDRVDDLFHDLIGGDDEYSLLYKVIKMLLCLSHGQATVERGFSINKKVEVENMSLNTLTAQRTICDHVTSVGGINKVVLSKELLVAARLSRHRYEAYLQSEREAKKSAEENNKRKRVLEELDEMKKKRARLESDIQSLEKTSDGLYDKAESTGKITFVTQANSLKKTAKDKKKELELLNEKLNQKLEQLKK